MILSIPTSFITFSLTGLILPNAVSIIKSGVASKILVMQSILVSIEIALP